MLKSSLEKGKFDQDGLLKHFGRFGPAHLPAVLLPLLISFVRQSKNSREHFQLIFTAISGTRIRREHHQSYAQPGFRAETKKGAISGQFRLFSCVLKKTSARKTSAQPWYARKSGNSLAPKNKRRHQPFPE